MTRCSSPAMLLGLLVVPAAAQSSAVGSWDPPVTFQVDGVHAAILPTGEALFLPHRESQWTASLFFDPNNPGGATYPSSLNFFCSGHTQLADGRQLFVGGEDYNKGAARWAGTFDASTGTWTNVAEMVRPRWYPSAVLAGDGKVWVFGGQSEAAGDNDDTIEYYDPASNTWALAGGQDIPGQYEEAYNRLHLMPDGRFFNSGHLPQTHLYDPVARTWEFVDTTNLGRARGDGGSVKLQDGRVLIVGGADEQGIFASAEVIDLSQPDPQWTNVASMGQARFFIDTVLLPDGNVLVVGGEDEGAIGDRTPELYDPSANSWTDMAPFQIPRGYHATALLLPDARVMIAGGEGQNGPGLYDESGDIEIWNPYYLFQGPRPVIDELPGSAAYGQTIGMCYSALTDVSHVVIHKAGSATHAFTYNQISQIVDFDSVDARSVTFTIPSNPNVLPPGYYMVFLMSSGGVPSVAKWLQVGGPPAGPTSCDGGSSPGIATCFGDSGCPCGNDDPSGTAGCATSTGTGASLAATGTAGVAADQLSLNGSGMPSNTIGVCFMGNAQGQVPFFDGFRCALGTTFRFSGSIQGTGSSGTLNFTGVVGASNLITPGGTWSFQYWFRDVIGPCGTGANLTNLYSVTFTP